jgi:hypothetical protein
MLRFSLISVSNLRNIENLKTGGYSPVELLKNKNLPR